MLRLSQVLSIAVEIRWRMIAAVSSVFPSMPFLFLPEMNQNRFSVSPIIRLSEAIYTKIAKRTQKSIGIAGKQPALRAFPLPASRHAERGAEASRSHPIRPSACCLSRSVPLLVKQIVIPPRRPIESASREEGLGEKLEAGSSGLSPKLECTDRNLIVSDC